MDINRQKSSINAFFALVRAGLWGDAEITDLWIQGFTESVDWEKVYQLAEEQSVVGLVLAGIEHSNAKPPQELLLQWIGEVQMIEQQNKEMNSFIAELVEKLRTADIYTLLVKGQGIAQCYERPLWRVSGDIDLLLSLDNYEKAKAYLSPLASVSGPEEVSNKHLGMNLDGWLVELHGKLRCSLSSRINRKLKKIYDDVFYGGNVRSWLNNDTQIFLMGVEGDILYVFVHFLSHFYKGGVGLRQICDWCRLIWTYKDSLNLVGLESGIWEMGLMTEWKAFAAFVVDSLGMPADVMPLYSPSRKWSDKAEKICSFIMEVGNFGINRDLSYYSNETYLVRKAKSFRRVCVDLIRHGRIFPCETMRFFPNIVFNGLKSVARGE